jgi:hypothetical protein
MLYSTLPLFAEFFAAVMVVWVLLALMLMPTTWLFFLAVMHLKQVRDAGRMPKFAERAGTVLLIVGLVLDFLCNVIAATLLFNEVPREWLVTQRLKRHRYGPPGWRQLVAVWLAVNLLDAFDPAGIHV